CQRMSRAAASRGRPRGLAVRRARRPGPGAAVGDPGLSHAAGIRRALRRRPGRGRARAHRCRGLPRPLRGRLHRAHAADRFPAPVRVHRPAGAGTRVDPRAGDGRRGGRGPAGAGGRRLRPVRAPGGGQRPAPPATTGAPLAAWTRRVPQGNRGDRQRAARGAGMSAAIQGGPRAQTLAVRAGIDRDEAFGAVTPPLVLSSNFSFAGFDCKRRYDYTRSGNPTRDLLADALASLEGGAGAVVTASGMAAVNLVLNALVQPGDRIVVPHDGYGGSWRLFDALARKGHFELVVADLTDPRALAEALREPPALVWIETPSNPLLRITDLRFVIDAAHRAGALAVVDNTFLSPAL